MHTNLHAAKKMTVADKMSNLCITYNTIQHNKRLVSLPHQCIALSRMHLENHRSSMRLAPCRVTNEGKELRVKKLVEEAGLLDEDYIVLDPQYPVPNPELGPLERQVSTTFEEGLLQEEIDPQAMNYWFTEPESGWPTEKKRLRKIDTEPMVDFDNLRHEGDAVDGRRPLSEFRVGDTLQGTVIKHMLYHGIQVDVGAQADGLIAMCELSEWRSLGTSTPEIGDVIEVTVHAVRDDPVFRFPLQVVPTDSALRSQFPSPDLHVPPLDLRDVDVSEYPSIAKRTGRVWEPQKVIVGRARDEDVDDGDVDEEDIDEDENGENMYLSEEALLEIDEIVGGKYA